MYPCHYPTHSLTRLVDLIDVTLACEDANSKLVEVFTVADIDAEKRVDSSLVQILKLIFFNFFQTFSPRFGQDFEVEVSARL